MVEPKMEAAGIEPAQDSPGSRVVLSFHPKADPEAIYQIAQEIAVQSRGPWLIYGAQDVTIEARS
jgi:hypothetical protein